MGLSDNFAWLLLGFVLGWNFSVNLLVLALSLGYLLVFALFTVASRPLVTSWADAPVVALKMQLNIASTLAAFIGRGFRPLYPNWSLAYEVTVFAMRFMFVDYGKVIAYENTAMMRPPFAMVGKMMLKSNCREHHTTPETVEANGLKHLWLRDEESKTAKQRLVVIHFHGGGYAISDPWQDVELANLTHSMVKDQLREKHGLNVAVDVLLANYRKAPEHPYPTPLDDCQVMYEHVLKSEGVRPKQVVFSGDSAGAEMSITICMRLRDAGRVADQPLACLMYSPDVDMSERGVDTSTPHCILTDNFADSVLDIYLSNIKDPEQRRLASPINNDLTNLPPLFIQLGTLERFYQQGLRFMEKVKKQGVTNVELDVLEGMPHDVVMFPTFLIPFAKEAISHGCVFAAKHAAAMFAGEPEQEP